MQLAVGFIIRTLESASKIDLLWRDTSRCGVANSPYKPDFMGFVRHAEVWSTVVGLLIFYPHWTCKARWRAVWALARPDSVCIVGT